MTDPVEHLARLAGIDLDAAERERLSSHLAALQTLIDALPQETAAEGNPFAAELDLREDEPTAPLSPEIVAALMPRRAGSWLDLAPVREDDS